MQASSEEVFQECLDLLGGLALRDRIQGERICRIADEYIKELASDTGRRESFAIPGLDARLSSTLRRVAKMQFPEWSVWTLPLVAHEYGHVVIEESGLKSYAQELAVEMTTNELRRNHGGLTDWIASVGADLGVVIQFLGPRESEMIEVLLRKTPRADDGGAVPTAEHDQSAITDALEELRAVYSHQRQRARVLLADTLATLLAGPAYAYAALLLRLNPLHVEKDAVSDQERAATILAALRSMNECAQDELPPHGDIVDGLHEYWRGSVAAASHHPADADAAELEAELPIDPGRVRDKVRFHLPSHRLALYEGLHSNQAVKWSEAWQVELRLGQEFRFPNPTRGSTFAKR